MSQSKKRLSLFSFGSNSSGESNHQLSTSPTDLAPPGLEKLMSGSSEVHPKLAADTSDSTGLKPATDSHSRSGSDAQSAGSAPPMVMRARSTSDISQKGPSYSPDSIFERLVQDCCTIDETCILEQPASSSPISSHSTGNSNNPLANPILGMASSHTIHPPKCDRCRRSKSSNCNHHGSQVQLAGQYFMKSEDLIPPALDATTSIFSDKDTNLDQVEMIYSNRRNSSVISLNMALGRTPGPPGSLGGQFPNSRKNSSYSLTALNTAGASPIAKALPISTSFANPFEYTLGNAEASPTGATSTLGQGGFHSPLSPASYQNSTTINNNLNANSLSANTYNTNSYNSMAMGQSLSTSSTGGQQAMSSASSASYSTPPSFLNSKPRRSLSFYSYADMVNLEDHPTSRKPPLIKHSSSLTFLYTQPQSQQQQQQLQPQSPKLQPPTSANASSLNYLTSSSPLTFATESSNFSAGPQLPPAAIPSPKHKMASSQLSKVFRRKQKKPQASLEAAVANDVQNKMNESGKPNATTKMPAKLALPISPESSDSEDNVHELTELDFKTQPPRLVKRKSVSSQVSSLWDNESLVLTSIGECIRRTTSEINGL